MTKYKIEIDGKGSWVNFNVRKVKIFFILFVICWLYQHMYIFQMPHIALLRSMPPHCIEVIS